MKLLYKARNLSGKIESGLIEAENRSAARLLLEKRKLTVLSVKKEGHLLPFGRGISETLVSRFTRELATMLNSGLPLTQALDVIARQKESRLFHDIVRSIASEVREGKPLWEALKRHEKVFPPLYSGMVKAGESAGALGEILERLAHYLERSQFLKRKVRSALLYPAIVLAVAVIAVSVLLTFVVPSFAKMFADMGKPLPFITRIVVGMSYLLRNNLPFILAALVGLVLLIRTALNREKGRLFWDRMVLKLPLLGSLLTRAAVGRFCRTLATLLKGGAPLTTALDICSKSAGNKVIENAIHDSIRQVSEGRELHESLSQCDLFPEMTLEMIGVGEKVGELEKMMEKVAEFYDAEVTSVVDSIISVIEPIMIVMLGIVIGFVLIAMYLPMFDMIMILE
ncbi:MAG: hypothetical protein A2293_13340 [Elusimicrobia bacterium RIFOXYB2_FULL_49_7]|nr:MAG: hypothetical protein A2293_13340 [Elusimicrobia bacterium RIFOXYB2_FULL_49_7]